jgi:hypothetical protein
MEANSSSLEMLINEIVKAVESETGSRMSSPDYLGCMFPPDLT